MRSAAAHVGEVLNPYDGQATPLSTEPANPQKQESDAFVNPQMIKRAQELLNLSGKSSVSDSPYDASWVLRSRVLDKVHEQQVLEGLLKAQKADGSWGARLFYIHDRVVNTLAVVVALAELGLERAAMQRGVEFLQSGIPRLGEGKVETIGFELVFPGMMESAQAHGLDLPYNCPTVLQAVEMGRMKKRLIPPGIFARQTPLAHSIEAFSGYADSQLFPNGSLGGSPAATASFLMQKGPRNECLGYLRQFEQNNWSIPSIHPFEVFEHAWILYNFHLAGLLDRVDARPQLDAMWRHLQKFNGASISDDFPVIDSDDTAMAYIVLKEANYPVSPAVLEQFEEKKWFRCFELERNPSISANIHVLDAVRRTEDYPRREEVIAKLLAFLRESQRDDGSWLDKWHISPYYCTGHAVLALKDLDPEMTRRALHYLMTTQKPDGSWGVADGSSEEETAYALQALASQNATGVYTRFIEAGQRYMSAIPRPHSELWVDKGLYCPTNVVESACLAWRSLG